MKHNPLYPDRACPVAEIENHPAFIGMMKAQSDGTNKNSRMYFEILRVAMNPERYRDGINYFDFADECASQTSLEDAVNELERMKVFRVAHVDGKSRLVPCEKIEAAIIEKAGRKMTSMYLRTDIIEAAKAAAYEQRLSMSRIGELALVAYLGLPADDVSP